MLPKQKQRKGADRSLSAFGLLGAAALALASPLVDVEKTSLSLDRRPELLDEGHITVHLARVVRNGLPS